MLYQCESCGASISGVICDYCGHRNAIDLKRGYETHADSNNERVCPNCDIFLDTLIVDKDDNLYIEMCRYCKGLFLDHGEIEAIMEKEIVKTQKGSLKALSQIINNPISREKEVRYKKCPNCQKIMSRINYKQKSGVIMDLCKECGYWLDAGELRQIMEWAKLEGCKDFTPTMPTIGKRIMIKSSKPLYPQSYINYREKSLFIDSFLRKLYGF